MRQRSRSEEHTSELQSQSNIVCRLLLEKKNDRRHDGKGHTDNWKKQGPDQKSPLEDDLFVFVFYDSQKFPHIKRCNAAVPAAGPPASRWRGRDALGTASETLALLSTPDLIDKDVVQARLAPLFPYSPLFR